MSKNVGVSTGCPWKSRRYMNEIALDIFAVWIFCPKEMYRPII